MATEKEKRVDAAILRYLFDYCQETGILIWKNPNRGRGFKQSMEVGKPAFISQERKGYTSGVVCGERIKGHRAVWAWHYGCWPKDQIDHINGVTWDNKIENLRESINGDNCRNQSKPKSNTSGWIGVSFNKRAGNWCAKYRKNYIDYHVGYFNCPNSAGLAVMRARCDAGFSDGHGRNKTTVTDLTN